MRKIITTTYVSLDGVMQGPGGPQEDTSGGFKRGGWMGDYWDGTAAKLLSTFMRKRFELLLGKHTYTIWASYWPTAKGLPEISIPFNRTKKYVVSHSKMKLSWNNSTLITGDVVAELKKLKKMKGPDLWVWGSGNLIQTLLDNQLVDTMHVWTFPVIVGEGKRLFEEGRHPEGFRLVKSKITKKGVVIATYQPAGRPKAVSLV